MKGHLVDIEGLPHRFPTHKHTPEFWEALGRVVATFGFLEETLGKAIFALTATTDYDDSSIQDAVKGWPRVLEKALYDTLGALITSFENAVNDNQEANVENLDALVRHLRDAATLRNVLCHGSWQLPDGNNRSIPRFVNRKLERFETPVDVPFLNQTQAAVAELACHVIDCVTHTGYQFPGSSGPGAEVWPGT